MPKIALDCTEGFHTESHNLLAKDEILPGEMDKFHTVHCNH